MERDNVDTVAVVTVAAVAVEGILSYRFGMNQTLDEDFFY